MDDERGVNTSPPRLVAKDTKSIKVKIDGITPEDVTFINRCIKQGSFDGVNAVLGACLKKVRREMAEREIRQMRLAAARESERVKALASSMRSSAEVAYGDKRPKAIESSVSRNKSTVKKAKAKANLRTMAKRKKSSRQNKTNKQSGKNSGNSYVLYSLLAIMTASTVVLTFFALH